MLVEFESVRSDLKESYDRDLKRDLTGEASVPFECEEDYIEKITIEMNQVIEFNGGRVYLNGKRMNCTYVVTEDGISPNLLIPYEEFKRIYTKLMRNQVLIAEEL